MKTVSEVSKLAGISVRTLHYYDEIGLLKPTKINDAGYRFYDNQALEILQQILFFREFNMPLKEIKENLENPDLDKNQLLRGQKKILVLKKERLERIIASIDDILKGENKMDFGVFSKNDMEEVYNATVNNLSEEQKVVIVNEFGSMEQFEKYFLEKTASEEGQKNLEKMVEWYGDKESALSVAMNPQNSKIVEAYSRRFHLIIEKLASKIGVDVHSFEVKQIIGELDFVAKQLYQMKDMSAFMTDIAAKYQNDKEMQMKLDTVYGEGTTAYIGQALEAFYKC